MDSMKERKICVGLTVLGLLFFALLSFGLSSAQSPPTTLIVVRGDNDTLWKMTCDEMTCSGFTRFPGLFRYQPAVTWDEATQEWVLVGTASDKTIWMSTFDRHGNFNNDWQRLPGSTPSPAGISGSYYGGVPIGAVIDWWRPNPTWAIPSGFAICDGSTVHDAESPLNGVVLPNLTNLFVLGVTSMNDIGLTGGSSSHTHTADINHDHPSVNSATAGSFTGTSGANPLITGTSGAAGFFSGFTVSSPQHHHAWIWGFNGDWQSWRSNGDADLMIVWGDGLDNEGSGIFPMASESQNSGIWYTDMVPGHDHQFSVAAHNHTYDVAQHTHQFSVAAHIHSSNIPPLGVSNKTTTSALNAPRYYGLLKIMRIR